MISTMTVIAQLKSEKREGFLHTLSSLYGNGEEEKALKKFTLHIITEWETQEDLENHQRTESFEVLRGASSSVRTVRNSVQSYS